MKEIRLARGMTQQQLADAVGITDAAVCQHENGTREPNLELIRKYCSVLHCTLDELIGNEVKDGDGRKGCAEAAAEDGEC